MSTILILQGANLARALIFCFAATFIPFGAGAEFGRYLTRAARARLHTAATARTPAATVVAGGPGKVD